MDFNAGGASPPRIGGYQSATSRDQITVPHPIYPDLSIKSHQTNIQGNQFTIPTETIDPSKLLMPTTQPNLTITTPHFSLPDTMSMFSFWAAVNVHPLQSVQVESASHGSDLHTQPRTIESNPFYEPRPTLNGIAPPPQPLSTNQTPTTTEQTLPTNYIEMLAQRQAHSHLQEPARNASIRRTLPIQNEHAGQWTSVNMASTDIPQPKRCGQISSTATRVATTSTYSTDDDIERTLNNAYSALETEQHGTKAVSFTQLHMLEAATIRYDERIKQLDQDDVAAAALAMIQPPPITSKVSIPSQQDPQGVVLAPVPTSIQKHFQYK